MALAVAQRVTEARVYVPPATEGARPGNGGDRVVFEVVSLLAWTGAKLHSATPLVSTSGLTKDERKFLAPIVLGSSVLFYAGIGFAYAVLTPAALKVSLFLFAYSFYVRTGN